MFFLKEKAAEIPSGNDDKTPRAPRYTAIARVRINGFEGEAVLRNINHGGFRLESRTYAAISLGERYTMWIGPEKATAVNPFELEVEVRWVRSTEKSFNAGFLITKPPLTRELDKYIDYVKAHNPVES
ncbi:MAG: PilZ domain-containing protein [Spirochaetaceae bacterium]|jgi:hypothetical protein|nr:PilZ domain-containing protein [Spirochaetaceae bacterium]